MSARTWVLVSGARRCDGCRAWIPSRTWHVEIPQPGGVVRVECEACAATTGALAPDWKARAAGEA